MGELFDYFNNKTPEKDKEYIQKKLSLLSKNPELEKEMSDIFDIINTNIGDNAQKAFERICGNINLPKRRGLGQKLSIFAIRSAAALFIPMSLVLGWLAYKSPGSDIELCEIQVPFGQTRHMTLSDGTELSLNSGTRITYPLKFKGKERCIFVDGEILADVAKNKRKPFVIKSGELGIRVIGTKFNFKSFNEDDCAEIMLIEGSVEVGIKSEKQNKNFIMQTGDLVQYDKATGNISLQKLPPLDFRSFKENRALHFYNLTLRDIARELERVFGKKIVIMDEKIAQFRYFAYFTNNENLEQILFSLGGDKKISIKKDKDTVYLFPK